MKLKIIDTTDDMFSGLTINILNDGDNEILEKVSLRLNESFTELTRDGDIIKIQNSNYTIKLIII